MSFDLYAEITNRMIAELSAGNIPWIKPWRGENDLAISHTTGKPYSFLNQMLLNFRPGEYLTFKQCSDEGGKIRRGEKGKMIVFWKWVDKKDGDVILMPDGREIIEQVPILKYYTVFHIDQTDSIRPRWEKPANPSPALSPDARAEQIIQGYVARSGVTFIARQSNQAFYRPSDDTVVVPAMSQYDNIAEYYSCAGHEIVHSSGHPKRLNRITDIAAFGSESYSKEELCAEMGSAFLVSIAGLETRESFRNSAAYIQGWLKALNDDKRLVVAAAGAAQKAVEFILGRKEV
jgi:antirestriction protein ArdC